MAYIVTKNIIDTKDSNRLYEKGEVYPRPDLNVTDARIRSLLKKGVIKSNGEPGDIVLPKEEIEEEAGE